MLMADPIHVPKLLAHAHALAKHSSAPISSLLTPIDRQQYQPWPTENAMRQGLLFQMEGSMSGVGQTGQVGDGMSLPHLYRCIADGRRGQRGRCGHG
jgi:mediator of RNA polymerase II transcription subunit 4